MLCCAVLCCLYFTLKRVEQNRGWKEAEDYWKVWELCESIHSLIIIHLLSSHFSSLIISVGFVGGAWMNDYEATNHDEPWTIHSPSFLTLWTWKHAISSVVFCTEWKSEWKQLALFINFLSNSKSGSIMICWSKSKVKFDIEKQFSNSFGYEN